MAETDFVGGFAGRDDYFLYAEFAGGFDDVVGAGYVAAIAFVVLVQYQYLSVHISHDRSGNGEWKRTGTNMFRA